MYFLHRVVYVFVSSHCVHVSFQGPLIVTEELHSLSFESELQLNQSGLNIKLEVTQRFTSTRLGAK